MAEFQWWLLIVGLVAGGVLVAVVTTDGRRREEDVSELERRAETTWIADRLGASGAAVDARAVEAVLRLHREFLALPPPDGLIVEGGGTAMDPDGGRVTPFEDAPRDPLDVDPDQVSDEVGDDGRGGPDQDLARAGVQQASSGEEADARPHGEERPA